MPISGAIDDYGRCMTIARAHSTLETISAADPAGIGSAPPFASTSTHVNLVWSGGILLSSARGRVIQGKRELNFPTPQPPKEGGGQKQIVLTMHQQEWLRFRAL